MTQASERSATLSQLVAEEVRAQLARRRMSGRQLAGLLGVSPSWVSYRLTGTQPIDVDDMQKIAEALGVPAIKLIEPALAALPNAPNAPNPRLSQLTRSVPADRTIGRTSRHTTNGVSPMVPQRRDRTRPVSAIPATRRRPTPVKPPARPIPA